MRHDRSLIIRASETLLFELRDVRQNGPLFRIVHRFCSAGTNCLPGEEVAAIYVVHRGCDFLIPLSLTLRLLVDYLAKYSRFPQNASQIEACFKADPFYTRHGMNVATTGTLRRRITRSAIKIYIQRIREALACAFLEAKLPLDPRDVLLSQKTVMNEVGYRLRAMYQWIHIHHQ